jgi:hypothetical protein
MVEVRSLIMAHSIGSANGKKPMRNHLHRRRATVALWAARYGRLVELETSMLARMRELASHCSGAARAEVETHDIQPMERQLAQDTARRDRWRLRSIIHLAG